MKFNGSRNCENRLFSHSFCCDPHSLFLNYGECRRKKIVCWELGDAFCLSLCPSWKFEYEGSSVAAIVLSGSSQV
jgi:hypothetical protein